MLATLHLCLLLAALFVARTSQAQAHRASPASSETKPPPRDSYAGDQACRSCHQKEFDGYQDTAHHLTSRIADAHSIAGNFAQGANTFKTANPSLYFKMTADADGFHQTAIDQISPGKAVAITRSAEVKSGELTWPASSSSSQPGWIAQLAALGIIVR